jgi:MoxR-like ATPase
MKPIAPPTRFKTRPTAVLREARPPMVSISATDLKGRKKMFNHVLDHMDTAHGTGLCLGGGTGIGKTTFVKQLGRLLGMKVVLLEAPHITEEHIINIPFVIIPPSVGGASAAGQKHTVTLDTEEWSVQLGRSALASELHSANPINDQQYMANMERDANTSAIFSLFGGTEDNIPDEIRDLRKRYKVILFIDEYWRAVPANVRNILRTILNGRIGNDKIPPGVYTVYASNMSDVGSTVEPMPMNADMDILDYKAPTKDELFHLLISSFKDLQPEVVNAFHSALEDNHIEFDDLESEIRTSPRRWEQIILYVNKSVPVKNKEDAAALLANVKSMFNDEEGKTSSLHQLVDDIVRKILDDMGQGAYSATKPLSGSDWRKTLDHQIAAKIKMGDSRKYIPVVSGPPGIGKTAAMADVATDNNMVLVHIDCSTLSAEDITGIPIPKRERQNYDVRFSKPSLLLRIEKDMEDGSAEFMNDPKISDEKKAQFRSQPYKYLVFFDEMNRVGNQRTFNSIRRVVLEKEFNDTDKLPNDAMIVAAINPTDKNVQKLTGHLKDSIDIIDAHPNWTAFLAYLDNNIKNNTSVNKYPPAAKTMALKVLQGFIDTFAMKTPTKEISRDAIPFNIKMQGQDNIYISPREYWTLYCNLVSGIARTMKESGKASTTELEKEFYDSIMAKIDMKLKGILRKHDIDSPQFMLAIASWLKKELPSMMVKQRGKISLEGMFDEVLDDHTKHLKDDSDFVNYVRSFDLNRFSEEMGAYVDKLSAEEGQRIDVLLANNVPRKQLEAGEVRILDDMVSKLEYIINEVKIAAAANKLSADITDGMETVILRHIQSGLVEKELPEELIKRMVGKIHDIFS